jgi:hypothetical protein
MYIQTTDYLQIRQQIKISVNGSQGYAGFCFPYLLTNFLSGKMPVAVAQYFQDNAALRSNFIPPGREFFHPRGQ